MNGGFFSRIKKVARPLSQSEEKFFLLDALNHLT